MPPASPAASDLPGRILVTGACGYLGSSLLRALAAADPAPHLVLLDNLQRAGQAALLDLPEGVTATFIEGDILDGSVVRRALAGVEAVVHLAAVVRTPMSFENPTWMHQINHWGTARLLESALEAGTQRFVYSSSAAVYGPGGPFDESAPLRPLGPYATSKAQAEHEIEVARERGLAATVLRLGMLFGGAPCMRFDGVINHLALRAATARALTVYGSGRQRRPAVHVDDAVRAILLALRGRLPAETWNAVAANPSVLDIVAAVRQSSDAAVRNTEQDILSHASFEVDGGRLRAAGWRPAFDGLAGVRAGIEEILARAGGFRAPFALRRGD